MAENKLDFTIRGLNPQTSIVNINDPSKGMVKDMFSVNEFVWTHARNAVNNSHTGDYLKLGNEPSNKYITKASYDIIGLIYLYDNIWVIFSTIKQHPNDNTVYNLTNEGCEIGLLNINNIGTPYEVYIRIVDDYNLNFCKTHTIYGTSRKNHNDEWIIYWDDGLNPTRFLKLGNAEEWKWVLRNPKLDRWVNNTYTTIPYVQGQYPLVVDVPRLDLIPNVKPPIFWARQSKADAGTLPNGTYMVSIAYLHEGNRITDYYHSDPIPIYSDSSLSGSINVYIDSIEEDTIKEYELVITYLSAEQLISRKIGNYSVSIKKHNIDTISPVLENVDITQLLLNTSKYKISDMCVNVGEYLIRISPHEKFEINYQPLANLIVPKYVIAEVDEDYYENSGKCVGYMRDEVYQFYIRWIYKDGSKTNAYIIPALNFGTNYAPSSSIGLYPTPQNLITFGGNNVIKEDVDIKILYYGNFDTIISTEKYPDNPNVFNIDNYINNIVAPNYYQIHNQNFNTSQTYSVLLTAFNRYISECGGGYTSSSIPTPNKANISNQNIRLARVFDESEFQELELYDNVNRKFRIVGAVFANIVHPIDNNGDFIDEIIGYEILRADRSGNKTVIAKGIMNHYGEYHKTSVGNYGNGLSLSPSVENYLYQNYPLNDIRPNNLLTRYEARYIGQHILSPAFQILTAASNLNSTFIDMLESPFFVTPNTIDYYVSPNNFLNATSLLGSILLNTLSVNPLSINGNICHNYFSKKRYSFHSPDTTFKSPYLNVDYGKIYKVLSGNSTTQYFVSHSSPKQKIFNKNVTLFMLLYSIYATITRLNGEKTLEMPEFKIPALKSAIYSTGDAMGPYWLRLVAGGAGGALNVATIGFLNAIENNGSILALNSYGMTSKSILNSINLSLSVLGTIFASAGGIDFSTPKLSISDTPFNSLPRKMRRLMFIPFLFSSMSELYGSIHNILKATRSYLNYALFTTTHCFYDKVIFTPNSYFFNINKAFYIKNHNTTIYDNVYGSINIMNKDRNRHVYIEAKNIINISYPIVDISRFRLQDLFAPYADLEHLNNAVINNLHAYASLVSNPSSTILRFPSSVYYGSIKVNNGNVYNNLYNNKLIKIGLFNYSQSGSITTSNIVFGGDTYIGRYAERNPFHYFDEYPLKMPDGLEYNYLLHRSILYPRYWINTAYDYLSAFMEHHELADCSNSNFMFNVLGIGNPPQDDSDDDNNNNNNGNNNYGYDDEDDEDNKKNIIKQIKNLISNLFGPIQAIVTGINGLNAASWNSLLLTTINYNLDGDIYQILHSTSGCNRRVFGLMKNVWFYLSHIGIREFVVESEINLAFRRFGDSKTETFYHYKKNSSLGKFIDEDVLRLEDYYSYDWSMSISKFYSILGSFAVNQKYDYDPVVASIIAGPRKNMLIYSLKQDKMNHRDNWHIFLPLNFKVFNDTITTIKSFGDNGALILFKNESPILFVGVDTLTTQNDIKITIGDGGLFNQPLRSASNSDRPYEYGSLQHRNAIVNTPFGIYYFSIDQDKIFLYDGSIKELDYGTLKWWLNKYCRFNILDQFPNFNLLDNPAIGVTALASYDNQNGIVYFHKKDYMLKGIYMSRDYKVIYNSDTGLFEISQFVNGNWVLIDQAHVDDERYFEDVSWTLSYDPKINAFISFHDWHPEYSAGTQDTFFTIKKDSIWLHNALCDSYCNYYGRQYPFEIEYETSTGVNVTSLRSIEYMLEAYKYSDNCDDRFHVLDQNFDECIVYNSEQCSGLMRLVLKPKNDPRMELQYPIFTPTHVEILYSKEEQKYRINQIYDLISDRGEFTNVENIIFTTQKNGYVKDINPIAIDYNKPQTQRKKIRHYKNRIFLRKVLPPRKNNIKLIFIAALNKKLLSLR